MLGVSGAVTGRQQSSLPPQIEQIQPSLGDKVLNQTEILVHLVPGYGGRLLIDDVALPTASTQQVEPGSGATSVPATTVVYDPFAVRFDAGTNTLTYLPKPGARIERFSAGRHFVKVLYWKLVDGEVSSYSYTWYFDVIA